MLQDKRTLGLVAGCVVLAGIAVAGWARHTPSNPALNVNGSNGLMASPQAEYPAPVNGSDVSNTRQGYPPSGQGNFAPSRQQMQESGYSNNYAGSYQQDGYYSSTHRPVYVHQNVPQTVTEEVINDREPVRTVYEGGRTTRVYRTEMHHGRSTGKSVAIVAGTAGVGAAIGALAGGGKGAAIGALSGGGAGFVYDRLTHNH